MTNIDSRKFSALIAGITELYGKSISTTLIEIYWNALQRFSLTEIQHAFSAHINNPDSGQYFPKPADVVRLLEGGTKTQGLQAWSKVEKAIRQVGAYRSLAFDDPLTHAVIEDMGGWIRLCDAKLNELPFRANEFQQRYRGFLNKPPLRYPKHLVGIVERDNAAKGYGYSPPLLIGNAELAKQIIANGGGTPLSIQSIIEDNNLLEKNNND